MTSRTRGWAVGALAVLVLTACTPAPRLVEGPVTSPVREEVDTGELVVGVTSLAGGYNPHHLSDQSAITTALANLVLPSVFRPGPDGVPRLDRTVMSSAEVTNADPYTVTYRIRSDASWSDNAPVAAEDFVYLWEQITGSPGAIDAAGYRLIADIAASDGGKVVEVVFDRPYPGWRSLFANLLPAHLLKDAPGGWDGALRTNFPATAGPYSVKSLDVDRGNVVLERSDRYWEEPATLDRIVLRRADQGSIIDALDAGHDQLALASLNAAGVVDLAELAPAITAHTVARPTVATLAIRPDQPQLRQLAVRQAIVAALDREQLIAVATSNGPAAALRADAQVLAPTLPGYQPTIPTGPGVATPARHDPALATELLTGAGYTRTAAGWAREGQLLEVVIGAPEEREPARRVAEEAQRQLIASGIPAEVATMPADELYGQLYAANQTSAQAGGDADGGPGGDTDSDTDSDADGDGDSDGNADTDAGASTVDLAVIAQPVGGDQASVLATNFGCAPDPDGTQPRTAANPLGFCDVGLQPTIDAALTGALSVTDALAAVEPVLWRAAVAVPLFQEAETLAVRPEVSAVTVGPPMIGPFAGAERWRRTAG